MCEQKFEEAEKRGDELEKVLEASENTRADLEYQFRTLSQQTDLLLQVRLFFLFFIDVVFSSNNDGFFKKKNFFVSNLGLFYTLIIALKFIKDITQCSILLLLFLL